MNKLKPEELAGLITDFVNTMSLNQDSFNAAMSREHRTLQQSFTRLCLKWIEHCASDEYRYDPRNEGSHVTAREIVEWWKKENGFLPSQNLGHI